MDPDPLLHLKTLLSASEIIEPSSPSYRTESLPWAAQKDLHPRLVVRPATLESLSIVLAYLSQTPLDFAIRSQGFGSSSAKDVLISMTASDGFEFDREKEVVTVGVGQTWEEYYKKMEKVAPDYAGMLTRLEPRSLLTGDWRNTVVACRTPCIGVGGSILCGGFSWLSGEYGLTSDPQNMLDAQVVKLDGQVVWASTEPDLLWALRGAGGSFGGMYGSHNPYPFSLGSYFPAVEGKLKRRLTSQQIVVTAFKLRAYRYTQSIFAGPIFLPKNTLPKIARAVADFTQRSHDGKMTMFLYVLKKELLDSLGAEQDMVVVHAFDAHGEEHGRSEQGFGWALALDGAVDGSMVRRL